MSDFQIDAKHARRIFKRITKRTIGFSLAALKSTLRYGLKVTNKTVVDRIRQDYALKKTEIRKEFLIEKKNLGGMDINKQSVRLGIFNKAVGLIRLVVGKKEVPSQKGVRPQDRKVLRVRIRPGQTKKDKGLFLAKVKGGGKEYVQVFRRVKKTKSRVGKGAAASGLPMEKQSLKSPHFIFMAKQAQDDVVSKIKPMLEKKFMEEFLKKASKGFKIKF